MKYPIDFKLGIVIPDDTLKYYIGNSKIPTKKSLYVKQVYLLYLT